MYNINVSISTQRIRWKSTNQKKCVHISCVYKNSYPEGKKNDNNNSNKVVATAAASIESRVSLCVNKSTA